MDILVTILIIGLRFTMCPHLIKMAPVNNSQQQKQEGGAGFAMTGSLFSAQCLLGLWK